MTKYRITPGFKHTHFGVLYDFPEGIVVQASDTVQVANMEHDPPLVATWFIEANSNFQPLKKSK